MEKSLNQNIDDVSWLLINNLKMKDIVLHLDFRSPMLLMEIKEVFMYFFNTLLILIHNLL